jgi:hypothetical protein
MPPPARRTPTIGDGAGNGVRDPIEDERDRNRCTTERARQPDDLLEVEEDEEIESRDLDLLADLPDAIGEFRANRESAHLPILSGISQLGNLRMLPIGTGIGRSRGEVDIPIA